MPGRRRDDVRDALPELPSFSLEREGEPERHGRPGGFCHVASYALRARLPDGARSERFVYDAIERPRLDAVVIAAHFRDAAGVRHVYLRSAVRPPVAMRPRDQWAFAEAPTLGSLWETPAGLVEPDERSPEGLRASAARELAEELGFEVAPSAMRELGPSSFPSPGVIGERHFYFAIEVDPSRRGTPTEDGSVLERQASVVAIPLARALDAVRAGEIEDAKTELALRRLAEQTAS